MMRKVGKHGMELPPVGIGLMSVGGGIMAYDKEQDEPGAFEMIEAAIEASNGGSSREAIQRKEIQGS